MGTQHAPDSSLQPLSDLRRLSANIAFIWRVVVCVLVSLTLLTRLLDHPGYYTDPRGWLLLALSACFLAVFIVGRRWVIGKDPAVYFTLRGNEGKALHPWRAVIFWATLIALCLAMITLNVDSVVLLWVPFGAGFMLFAMPLALALILPTALLMVVCTLALPTSMLATQPLGLGGLLFSLSIWSFALYLPVMLMRTRFQREQTYQKLEQMADHERELAVLRERSRMTHDFHDTLGNSLAAIALKLELAQRQRAADPVGADQEVAATRAFARSALADLRTAITNMRSVDTLRDALARAAREAVIRCGWRLTWEIAPDVEPLNEAVRDAVLHTGLEALANIEKHANAHGVCLSLTREGDTVVLRVSDDGVGILVTNPPQRVLTSVSGVASGADERERSDELITSPEGHFGLTGMRERVINAGGSFMIGPGPDAHGTCLEARLPSPRVSATRSDHDNHW